MASKNPNVQPRNQYSRDWGNYATPNDLPNAVAGVPPAIAVNKLGPLEAGDTAFVVGAGLYQCFNPGVPPDGLAQWLQVSTPITSVAASRRDHSVNGALVDGVYTSTPVLRTKTDQHPVGAYAGGGIGNKAILGSRVAAPIPLGSLTSIEFTVQSLTPEQTPLAVNTVPYMNLVVELVPASGTYSIFIFGDVLNPLNQGTYSVPAPGQHKCVWTPALGNNVLVVNMKGMATFSLGPVPPAGGMTTQIVVPTLGPAQVFNPGGAPPPPPALTTAAQYQSYAYSIASILAVYPGARVVNAYSADGGLPKSPNITSGLLLIAGSSANSLQNAVRVLDWRLNSVPI